LNWRCAASDSDGSNLIAGVYGGRLYTSSDSGVDWTERRPGGASNFNWLCAASDNDGSNLIAGAYVGRLYTSSNGGVDWTERQPGGDSNLNWRAVGSDSNGSNLIAGVDGGRLYTSSTIIKELESIIVQQGTYSMKVTADASTSLDHTLERTRFLDLNSIESIEYDIYALRTGSNIKLSFIDSNIAIIEDTANVLESNVNQTESIDISGIADASKDTIDTIRITIVDASDDNIFYLDDIKSILSVEEGAGGGGSWGFIQ